MITHILTAWSTNITSGNWWSQFLHPGQLRDRGGYWFWSGIGSDIGEITLIAAVIATAKHLNCHQLGCWRRGALQHLASGTRWCHQHAPEDLRAAHPHRHIHWPEQPPHS